MSDDISPLLDSWPYDESPGLQVRRVEGRDGHPRLQIRTDLGLLQLTLTGRPDGKRPHGYASLLDFHTAQVQEHRRCHGWYEGFELDTAACAALRLESLQYYHRRIALMALQDYARAVEDADHNLQILDLLKAFAREQEDWLAVEQFRAFITSHKIESLARQHLLREDVEAALLELERGVRQLREIFAEQDRLDTFEESIELAALLDLRRRLEAQYQIGYRQRLRLLLDDALRREDPDTAADLRAQLRELEREE